MFNSIFKIIFFIEVLAITVIRSFYTRRKFTKSVKTSHHTNFDNIFMMLEVIGMIIPFIFIFSSILDFANFILPLWVGWAGAALFLLAIILLWRAHHDIGRYWVMSLSILDEHKLIKTGVYKYIRHPLYTSHMIWAIAQVMMLNNWVAGFSFIIVFVPHYLYRVNKEEKMLIAEFGDEYISYMKDTGRLFPKF